MKYDNNPNQEIGQEEELEKSIAPKPEKDLMTQESTVRLKRDQALEDFRANKFFGSFNSDYIALRGKCKDSDITFQNSYAAKMNYFDRLKDADKSGKPLKKVSGESRSMLDNKVVDVGKSVVRGTALAATTALSWIGNAPKMYAEIAGSLWDFKEFRQIRNLIILTEEIRNKMMLTLDQNIGKIESKLKDRDAEKKMKKKDEAAVAKIRKGLQATNLSGFENENAVNDNDLSQAA
jgi:hypothetical protein